MLLIGGDVVSRRQTGVEAQMGDGREGGLVDFGPEVELADDPAFTPAWLTQVMVAGAGIAASAFFPRSETWSSGVRRAGIGSASFNFAIRRSVISGWSIMRPGHAALHSPRRRSGLASSTATACAVR